MPGVAHTFGTETHKTIHFSLDHIERSASKHEIMGVLVHEVVHCYQYDANGTAPGGLIEGFAGVSVVHPTGTTLTMGLYVRLCPNAL